MNFLNSKDKGKKSYKFQETKEKATYTKENQTSIRLLITLKLENSETPPLNCERKGSVTKSLNLPTKISFVKGKSRHFEVVKASERIYTHIADMKTQTGVHQSNDNLFSTEISNGKRWNE